MGELTEDSDNEYPDLIEKQEKREHEYLQENHPGADSGRKGEPHRITADVVKKEKQVDDTGSKKASDESSENSEEIDEIHYEVEGGDEVRMGSPEEAIMETSDLESVKQLLEKKGILEDYRGVIAEREESDTGQDSGSEEMDTVEVDGEEYLLDPRDESEGEEIEESDSEEGDEEDNSEQKILMRNGEVVV
jgi:hypothetical protein